MYLGWSKWEWVLPTIPSETHNYLERTYTREELQANKYKDEADSLVPSPVYERYYLAKKDHRISVGTKQTN